MTQRLCGIYQNIINTGVTTWLIISLPSFLLFVQGVFFSDVFSDA